MYVVTLPLQDRYYRWLGRRGSAANQEKESEYSPHWG
jgi:hypothetical protein